jgi:hypothetical protein
MDLCQQHQCQRAYTSSIPEEHRLGYGWRGVGKCSLSRRDTAKTFMIRKVRNSDLPRLKELGFEHEFTSDFIEGICATDENDVVVMFAGAWSRAEVHMASDKTWGTPGARLALLQQVHREMEKHLKARNVGQVITWLDGMKGFSRRLHNLGWFKSQLTSWHRRIY